ncbi:MAG: hypothetical protein CFH08_00168 [Alphaproteobacteria bacterium MarineAlpha3_Bin7]|nr:MAG: hypothetical protein CFH08_00168 [Alphaproteobacteria bacterium MarineAlpha3_Bin7]
MLLLATIIINSIILGTMIFFSFVMAPLIFTKLEVEIAGKFIRVVFPWYYLFLGILSLFSLIAMAFANRMDTIFMILFFLGVVVSRQIIMPKINIYRDQSANNDRKAESMFNLLHRSSVGINFAQIVICLIVISRLVLYP